MPAFLFSVPGSIPGLITRSEPTVEPSMIDSTHTPAAFGLPVVVDSTSHKIRSVIAGDTAASVFGFLVRSYPMQSSGSDFGSGAPTAGVIGDVLKRGYIGVTVAAGSAVKGGTVYVRLATGNVEAAADGANTVALANAYFTGSSDANGNAEVAFNL